jgi:hypothetical protein
LTFHHFAVDLIFVVVEVALRFSRGRVFSVTKRLIIACGLLAALPFAASASKLISCSSCDPTPVVLTSLGTGALDVPLNSSSSDQEFEFENDTGGIITSLEFDATIDPNLTDSNTTIVYNTANPNGEVTMGPGSPSDPSDPNPILTLFSCAQQVDINGSAAAGFFQNCTVTYNTTTGDLSYLFAGTGPPNPDYGENLNFGTWKTQEAGIPSCPVGEPPAYCVPPPPPPGGPDADRGIFTIGFEGFQAGSPAAADYTNPSGPLDVTGSYTAVTPEPSYALLLVSGLFLLWFVRRRKVAQ